MSSCLLRPYYAGQSIIVKQNIDKSLTITQNHSGMIDKTFDIMVVGELNADLILSGDVTPEYGQVEKLIDDASLVPSGE